MASAAFADAISAINKTYARGSAERNALTRFVTEGLNVNKDREACRIAKRAWPKVAVTMGQTWGL